VTAEMESEVAPLPTHPAAHGEVASEEVGLECPVVNLLGKPQREHSSSKRGGSAIN